MFPETSLVGFTVLNFLRLTFMDPGYILHGDLIPEDNEHVISVTETHETEILNEKDEEEKEEGIELQNLNRKFQVF